MGTHDSWQLHSQLAADTIPIGDLGLSHVLLMNDATYPWLILVPRVAGITEIIDLPDADRGRLMDEISRASEALKSTTRCDKLNVAAIGNVVPQLHIHIVARRRGDPAWPKPVWGIAPPQPYAAGQAEALISTIRGAMRIA